VLHKCRSWVTSTRRPSKCLGNKTNAYRFDTTYLNEIMYNICKQSKFRHILYRTCVNNKTNDCVCVCVFVAPSVSTFSFYKLSVHCFFVRQLRALNKAGNTVYFTF